MASSSNPLDLQVVWNDPETDSGLDSSNGDPSRPHWTDCTRAHLSLYFLAPMLALVVLTAGVRCFDLDLRITRLFFDAEVTQFPALRSDLWLLMYRFGPLPGLVLGIGSTAMFVASFIGGRWRPVREPCAFMALLLALGPGLLVNGILKPSWDRPRPCELVEFGGDEDFVPVLHLSIIGEHISKSFPSGHASIGFYLIAPMFVFARRNRHWAIAFLALGLSLGFAMGFGRVAQGRHFPSDVLWSGAIVYFSGLCLACVLRPVRHATWSQAFAERDAGTEPTIFRIDEYRQQLRREINSTQSPARDTSKRRVA